MRDDESTGPDGDHAHTRHGGGGAPSSAGLPRRSLAVGDAEDIPVVLRKAGLRVTSPRVLVLTRLRESPHTSADELLAWVEGQPGAISRQGVYDVLASLEEAGLARRIEPAGHASRYETRVGDNHHHVVCRSCGAIADVDCAVGAMPCLEPSSTSGFTVDEAEINFWGLCPDCQQEGARAEGGSSAGSSSTDPTTPRS